MESSTDDSELATALVAPSERGLSSESSIAQLHAKVSARLFSPEAAVARVGRFVVLEELGRGAMGVVYAAYDEQLDRKIAIKVMRDDALADEEFRVRFVREGQALARLSHPNVVTVHEVGDSNGDLFLAMEFVRGRTVGDWLRTEPDWEEVLDAYVQAGRGLAAAHEAGLIHRDLKPHNLIRSDEGTVKVLDFGLVRIQGDKEPVQTHETVELPSGPSLTSSLTVPGIAMGTPAYMSPEQMQGRELDARSDQFSFCVALYEGLYGQRPHVETSFDERLESILSGRTRQVPKDSSVPSWVHEVIVRGLASDPESRWPSMNALLQALSRDPGRRRNLRVVGLVAVGMLGLAGTQLLGSPPETKPCTGALEHVEGIWDETRRTEIETAFLSVDRPHTAEAWERSRRELDAYASSWVQMHTDACEATTVRGEQSPQLLDLRMRCLEHAVLDLRATVETFEDADVKVVDNAHEVLTALPPLSRCADVEALTAEVEPPLPGVAEAVDAARFQLAVSRSSRMASQLDHSRDALDAAKELFDGAEYGPLGTEVALEEGLLFERAGDYDASERALGEALTKATRWKQRPLAHESVVSLMRVVGRRQGRPAEALRHRFLAEGLSAGEPEREASLRLITSVILSQQTKYEDAEAEARAALSLRESLAEPDLLDIATVRAQLAWLLRLSGQYEASEREYREVIALKGDVLGPEHPTVLSHRVNLSIVLETRNKHEDARAEMNAIFPRLQELYGPEHPQVAVMHTHIGNILKNLGEHEAAEANLRKSLSLRTKALGPEHLETARAHQSLGNFYRERGRNEEAEAELRAALSIRETLLDSENIALARTRMTIAYLLVGMSRFADALPLAEQVWARCSRDGIDPTLRADAAFVLAESLWEVKEPSRDRVRARELAEDALRSYERGEDSERSADGVRRWLDDHRLE